MCFPYLSINICLKFYSFEQLFLELEKAYLSVLLVSQIVDSGSPGDSNTDVCISVWVRS